MDTAHQWPQEAAPPSDEYSSKKLKPQKDEAPKNCPRCHSTNTKFCYFNNYSLSQPRHFCKACRRYWTAGGSLRNVPVGGGSRKNKRSSSNSSILVSKSGSGSDDLSSHFSFQNPNNIYTNKSHDQNHNLNLSFPPPTQPEYNSLDASRFLQVSSKNTMEMNKDNNIIQLNLNSSYSTPSSSTSTSLSAMELLKLNSHTFMPVAPLQNPNMMMQYGSGFHFQEFNKPQLGFAVDGLQRNANNQESINGAADQRLNFPFGAPSSSKHVPSANGSVDNQDKVDGNPTLYWNNGMSSGGSW
ncbi:hypothetical protein AgCh_021070 [Apium graveolens]